MIKNRLNHIVRKSGVLLAAALLITSMPETAYAVSESAPVETGSGIDSYWTGTAQNDAPSAEEADDYDISPEGAYQDTVINLKIENDSSKVGIFTKKNGVATAVSGIVRASSDENFSVYVVPKVSFELDESPVTLEEIQTDPTLSDYLEDSLIRTDVDEKDVTGINIPLQRDLASPDADYYWNNGTIITISAAHLDKVAKAGTEASITITAGEPTERSFYTIPVYIYDDTAAGSDTYHEYIKSDSISELSAVCDTALENVSIANALPEEEWNTYDWSGRLTMLKSDLSGEGVVTGLVGTDSTQEVDSSGEYFVDTDKKVIRTNPDTATVAYILRERSLGTEFPAIVLSKTLKNEDKTVAVNAADTKFADFSFTNDKSEVASSFTRPADTPTYIKPVPAEGADAIGVVVKDYPENSAAAQVSLGDLTHPARTLTIGNGLGDGSLQYAGAGGEKQDLIYDTDHWVLPGTDTDVEIFARTTETVEFLGKNSNADHVRAQITQVESPQTSAGSIRFTDGNYAIYKGAEGIYTGSDMCFTASPDAGYRINGIELISYTEDGAIVPGNTSLELVNGVYTVPNITGFRRIIIDSEAVESVITVKKADDESKNLYSLTDANTLLEIDETGASFGEAGASYSFRAEAIPGYALTGITAKTESNTQIPLNQGAEEDTYIIYADDMPRTGSVIITATVEKAVTITKLTNPDARITIDGSVLSDNGWITVSEDAPFRFAVTGLKGAAIDKVYWTREATADGTSNLGDKSKFYELSGSGGTYTIAGNDMKDVAGGEIRLIVLTTRYALRGTDYTSVKIEDGDGLDISAGLALWASDGTNETSIALGDTAKERTLKAVWTTSDGILDSVSGSAEVSFSLGKTTAAERIATFDKSVKNMLLTGKYMGGAADEVTDTVTISVKPVESGKEYRFPNTVVYRATLPLTVKPLRNYFLGYEYDYLTTDTEGDSLTEKTGLPEKTIRAVNKAPFGRDKAVLIPVGIKEDGREPLVMGEGAVQAQTGLSWSVTPLPGTTAALAKYAIEIDTDDSPSPMGYIYTTIGKNSNELTISRASEAQTLNVSTDVSFVDGTVTSITDSLKVINEDFGYFAIPVYHVGSGIPTTIYDSSVSGEMTVEISGTESTGWIEYKVYHALNTAGAAFLSGFCLTDAEGLAGEVGVNIEEVASEEVTWGSLTPAMAGYNGYLSITPSDNGRFRINGIKKTNTLPDGKIEIGRNSLMAKVGDIEVKSPTTINVTVVRETAKSDLLINSKDVAGGQGYLNPELIWKLSGFTASSVKEGAEETGKMFLNVSEGYRFELPGIEAFRQGTFNPKRTLAGWADDKGNLYRIGEMFTTDASSALSPVWAYRLAAAGGEMATDAAETGRILVINDKTKAEIQDPLNIAQGETLSVYAGYYELDTDIAPITAGKVTYSQVLTEQKSELELKTGSLAEGHAFLGADPATGIFEGGTFTGMKVTGSPVSAALTYTESEESIYSVDIPAVNVIAHEEWTFEIEDQTIENTQSGDFVVKTLRRGDKDVNLGNTADIAAITFESSDESIASVSVKAAATNTLAVTGNSTGRATVTATLISTGNTVVTESFEVTVIAAEVRIIAKVTPKPLSPHKAVETVTVGEDEVMELMIGSNTLELSAVDADGNELNAVNFVGNKIIVDDGGIPMGISGDVAISSAREVQLSPATLGTAELTITVMSGGKTYTRRIDAVSYGTVAVVGPVSSGGAITGLGTNLNQTEYFDIYEKYTTEPENKFAGDRIGYIPVLYNAGQKSYTVDIADYTAVWTGDGIQQEFFGWNGSAPAIDASVAAADHIALQGGKLTLTPAQVQTPGGYKLYPEFHATPITSIGAVDTVIRLTDEKPDSSRVINNKKAGGKTSADGTNWADYNIQVLPASAGETISVLAGETGIIDIASLDDGLAESGFGKNLDTEKIDTLSGETDGDSYTADGTNIWNGTVAFELAANGHSAVTTARRDNLRIAKVDGRAGALSLIIQAGALEPQTITIYANGEYTDTSGKVRYMEDGRNLESVIKTVDGESHVFDEDGIKVMAGPVAIPVQGANRIVMTEGGRLFDTRGIYTYTDPASGKTTDYYINADGYISTGLLDKAVTGLAVVRYADTGTGGLITYQMTYEQGTPGKWKDTLTGTVIDIDADTDRAEEADRIAISDYRWSKRPVTATFSGGVPEIKLTASLTSQKGEVLDADTIEIDAAVVRLPETATDKKIVFLATADLSDYYKPGYAERYSTVEKKYMYYINKERTPADTGYVFEDDAMETGEFEALFISSGSDILEETYMGYAIKPEIIVSNGEKTLVQGEDYTLSYSNNINVENKKPTTVTIKGKGNYSSRAAVLAFAINKKNLADDDVKVGNLVFKTGTADSRIAPVVSYAGKVLSKGSDYVLMPKAGSEIKDEKGNVVSKTFIITAEDNSGVKKHNFTGSKEVTVTYMSALPGLKALNWSAPKDWEYTGRQHILTEDNIKIENAAFEDLMITYSDNVNAGTCRITITAPDKSGKLTKSVKIAPAAKAPISVSNADYLTGVAESGMIRYKNTGVKPYVGLEVMSDAESPLAGTALIPGRDYRVTYTNNKQVASYNSAKAPTAKITYLGNYKGNKTVALQKFTIAPATWDDTSVEISLPDTMTIGKNGKAGEIFLKAGKNLMVTVDGNLLKSSEYTAVFVKEGGSDPIDKNAPVKAGDRFAVRIIPRNVNMRTLYGNNSYTSPDTYEIVSPKSYDLSKARIKILGENGKSARIGYTGVPVTFGYDSSALTDKSTGALKQAYITVTAGSGKNAVTIPASDLADPSLFTVTYANNTAKGKGYVIVSATASNPDFSGSVVTGFTIGAGNIIFDMSSEVW